MAHINDLDGHIFRIELDIPAPLAVRWGAQVQYIVSERMLHVIRGILTPEQVVALEAASVEFQPVVFPQDATVVL